MRRVVWDAPWRVTVDDRAPEPLASKDDCLVRVVTAGVCSHDARQFTGCPTRLALADPPVLGHELFGYVIRSGVLGLRDGAPVAVIGSWFCRACAPCRRGEVLSCEHFRIAAGGYADVVCIPAAWCEWRLVSLPAHVDPVAACFLDSIACAIRAVRLGGLSNHDTVLVGGGGFLGIIVALLAQHRGAKVVMVADSELSNRALAAVDLGRTSNNDPRLETLSPTVLVDVSGRKSLFEKFLRTAARPARIVIMTRAGESLCRHFNERADTLAVDFIRSFHSTVDDRQRATEALPVLAPAIRRLSVEYALEHAQKALTAVALKSHVRCHLTLAPKDAQLSFGPKPSMVQSIR